MIKQPNQTQLYRVASRKDFDVTMGDSKTWASMFRSYTPTHLGMMSANVFARQLNSEVIDKPFLYHSLGQGNYCTLPAGNPNYTWELGEDANTRFMIVDVDPNLGTTPGKNGEKIVFYLDRGGAHEPVVLTTESSQMAGIRILGQPVQEGERRFRYVGVIQDGDPNSFIDPSFLEVGKSLFDAYTSVSAELNYKRAGVTFGSSTVLSGVTGKVARKIEFTDRFIKLEIAARKSGNVPNDTYNFAGKKYNTAIGAGYVIHEKVSGKVGLKERINQGHFIHMADAILEDRINMDLEMMAVKGRMEKTNDVDTNYEITVAAGWLQKSKDGNYFQNSGSLTIGDLYQKIKVLTNLSNSFSNRTFLIKTGSDGLEWASKTIKDEAGISPFIFDSNHFIDTTSAQHTDKALRWGSQFTEIRMPNGYILKFVFDPSKDNPEIYPELNPFTGMPKESSSFDIIDLGETDAAPTTAATKSNMCWVMQPDEEEYFTVSNVYDMYTGSVKNGGNVAVDSKTSSINREKTGSLEFWDISRTMRIEYV